MELPHLGQQCNVKSCHQLDFLPILCQRCGGTFCKDHSLSLNHDCVEDLAGKTVLEDGKVIRHPCEFSGCSGWELTPVVCSGCGHNYCLTHRHQVDHNCAHQPQYGPSEKEATAASRIKELSEGMSGGEKKPTGRKSEALAAKVQLMKMKQKAVGEKGIPQEDRVYLLIVLPKSSSSSSIAVFVSRHWSIGRAIDAIAEVAKVKNNNNIAGAPKLRLFHPRDGHLLGASDQVLGSLITTGPNTLLNGQTLLLEYVADGTTHLNNFADYR